MGFLFVQSHWSLEFRLDQFKKPSNARKFDLDIKFDIKWYICYIAIKVIFGISDMILGS